MKTVAVLVLAGGFVAAAQAQDMPPGKGLEIMNDACGECHGTERVTSASKNREDWSVAVNRMLTKSGAPKVNEASTKLLIEYLVRNLGEDVNVNTATQAQLENELVLSPAEAAAIVGARTAKGNFKAWEDLEKVPGLDAKSLQPLKGRIKF